MHKLTSIYTTLKWNKRFYRVMTGIQIGVNIFSSSKFKRVLFISVIDFFDSLRFMRKYAYWQCCVLQQSVIRLIPKHLDPRHNVECFQNSLTPCRRSSKQFQSGAQYLFFNVLGIWCNFHAKFIRCAPFDFIYPSLNTLKPSPMKREPNNLAKSDR